jgi:starch synthase (maltosyl-transferring)
MGLRTGRIPIVDVQPCVDCAAFPAKAVVGETFPVTATVVREGHDEVGANVVLRGPRGAAQPPWTPMTIVAPGTDRWTADVRPTVEGDWTFAVEAWDHPLATWWHDAGIKIPAGIDLDLVLTEGALLFEQAAAAAPRGPVRDRFFDVAVVLRDERLPPEARFSVAHAPEVVPTWRASRG